MKRVFTIIGCAALAFITMHAQPQPQPTPIVCHNVGAMYINENTAATMYIGGGWQFSTDNVDVSLLGKVILTGDLINDVGAGNIFNPSSLLPSPSTSKGELDFLGVDGSTAMQHIAGTADKGTSYIGNIPTLTVRNRNAVQIDPKMGVGVNHLNLAKGRLILDSKVADKQKGVLVTDNAHLLVTSSKDGGKVTYVRTPVLPAEDKGVVQVNLALGPRSEYEDIPYHIGKFRIVGFSPPFIRIYADYFSYNFLTKPSPESLFGDERKLITNPRTAMRKGQGYLVGLGDNFFLEDFYTENVDPEFEDANLDKRVKETFKFARDFAEPSFSQYVNSLDSSYTGEALNIQDVPVPLTGKGYHYVGNPFTTPLDLSDFLDVSTSLYGWGVTRGDGVTDELYPVFYVVSQGTGSYANKKMTFTVSYLVGQGVGGTVQLESNIDDFKIAPMQMFLVRKRTEGESNFIIPTSARTHGNTKFLRGAPPAPATDELMIQLTDNDAGGYDRMCLVFRDNATTASTDQYDATKIFNRSGGIGQIYTISSDNKSMTTNVISPETPSVNLYLDPALETRNVTFSAHRLKGLVSVKTVILEDILTDTEVDLLATPEYSFVSSPGDPSARFILHFSRIPSGVDNHGDGSNIHIYYAQGKIRVNGLTADDNGSTLNVFDTLGRLISSKTITNYPTEEFDCKLSSQVYVINIQGKRNTHTKIAVSK